jgi:hypothetical protein
LLSLNEDFAHARKDWKCAREKYEELVDIGLAKQVVLWKFVERLRFGENCGVDGNGMRCKGGMSETSDLSEGSSEGGGWSWAGEGKGLVGCGGVGLDPNAVGSFFPPYFDERTSNVNHEYSNPSHPDSALPQNTTKNHPITPHHHHQLSLSLTPPKPASQTQRSNP